MKALYLVSLFLFGISLTGIPALALYLQGRWDFLIWGSIILALSLFVAFAVDDGMVKLLGIEWSSYIASVLTIALILVIGVSLQWR